MVHPEGILQAAERVFAPQGFFHTTTGEIEEEAEFGIGTFYKCFKSKGEVYFTLIDEKVEEINRLVKIELTQMTSDVEKIRKMLELDFEFIERNRDFFKIYFYERNRFE